MARFLDSTSSIKKEAGKKKKKQETTQPKQTTQSPSYSQKVQQTNQRLTQKYGGGGSGGSTRTTTSRTNPDQRTTQAQNQKMYGQPTQPVRRNQAELQRQKEERRSRAQEQKSGNFERPISRAQYADKRRATSFREKYTRWDNDIAETVGHTLKQTVAEDKRYLNRAAKGITMKDRHQWATPEQIRKADERTERRDRKYASQIEKEGQELEKLKQGHSYLGQQALSATSSATGMAADLAVGALTGTGEVGPLVHMFMRSTGGAYGQVKKKAASLRKQLEASGNYTPDELDEMFKDVNKRDELNAMASGGIEALSELMFRGFGPAAKYVGKGGSIAERAAGKLFKKAGGRATSGIVKNALRGTAEEVAEEEIGGPLQALAANTIYGNKYQKYSEDAVKRDFKAQSDELRSQIHSDEDAQMVTARLNSDAFMNDSIKAYMDSGMSEDEARQMAEMSREYLTASLSGDIDKMSEMQNKLVDKLAGGENSLKEKFTLRDAVDAAVSTSMMTLTTGVPGAISTAQAGRAYKGTQGLEGVRNLAEVVRNWDTEESAKAQKIIDAIDNGSDVSDTQVYELIQKAGSAAEAQSEAETTKDQIAQKGMEKYDLRVAPAVRDEYGDVTLSENTQQRYDKIVNDTVSRYDSLAKLGESERFEKAHVKQGASLAAAQMTGVITAEDVHELVKADPEVKAVFQDVTGIALDQFTEYDKNGNIDVAATNNSMMNALMAEAATNYINSARLEQAAWANDVRGEMLQTMSDNLNSKGDEALFDALQNIDPRDRDTFMLTGMASQYVYEHGWSTQDTWEEAKGDLQRIFPSLSVDSLQGVYEAAKEDRIESETPFLNAQVVKDEALTELAKSGQKAEVRGKFKNRTKRVLNAEETVICTSLAKQFNANITMVGEKNKNLSYIDENGEEKFSNAAVVLSKGEIYISKKADISKIIHEVTHMGAKLASTQYLDMAHYIMDKAYKHSPERTRMLVEAYKRTYQGQNLTDAQIEEEVVAEIVTAFEHDRVFLREIAQEEPSLFRRIYNAICDVIRTLRNILLTGRVLDPELQDTFLAKIGAYEETRRMWLDMMHEAAKNNAIVGLAEWENNAYKDSRESRDIKRTDNLNPTENEGVRLSITPEDREELNEQGVDVTEGGSVVRYSLESWGATNKDMLLEKLKTAGFEETEAKKWIDNVDSVAAVIAGDMTRLNYEADKFQNALKANSEYYYTLDLSTLCQKRRLYQGTYNAIMHRIVNYSLLPEDTVRLREMMSNMNKEVPCGICYEESRKKNEGKFAEVWLNGQSEKEYNQKLKQYEKNVEKYKQRLKEYEALENKGKKRKPKEPQKPERWLGYANMEHEDPYIPTLADVTTTDGRAKLREEHPEALDAYLEYQKGRGSANPKVSFTHTDYRGDILRMTPTDVKNVKHIGGLRIQSFSDFETVHVIDMMQAIMDMAAMNLTSQAYTKVPAFADIFGGTGVKINLSLIQKMDENGNPVYEEYTDENGETKKRLVFDPVEGIDPKEAFRIRDKYSKNVGTILVGVSDQQILDAWADDRVDMVIPFHRSGWSLEEFERLGLKGYDDYQDYQSERYFDPKKKDWISLSDAKMDGIYSADYWDYNKTGRENAKAYLKLCAEKHFRPVFYNFLQDNGDGTWSLKDDGSTDGYWKSLVDYKMYDNDKVGSPQGEVKPIFDMEVAQKTMDEYEGNADTLPVAEDVVEAYIKDFKKRHPKAKLDLKDDTRLSISVNLDEPYMAAVNSGDMDEAQRLVGEAAKMAGFPTPLYHGTDAFGFTVIDSNAPGADGFSFWAASREDASATYTLYGKRRNISDEGLSEEQRESMYDEVSDEIDDAISEFRYLVDKTFSEWVFGQQDNSYIRSLVDEANPLPGNGDGVYDVLSEIVFDAYHDYGMDSEMEYDDWSEESEEGKALWDAVNNIEALRGKLADIENGEIKGGIYGLYANTDNLYELDAKGKAWNELRPEGLPGLPGYTGVGTRPYKTRDVANWARENGYDGVRFRNIKDNGQYGRTAPFDVYAFFNPQSQVRSADPVTYADDGSVIPLSERFDPNNNDIRYSLPTQDSDGNILTDGQMEYFKNSQARDEQGRLQTMYHGTESAGFTVFNSNYGNSSRFFFFTDSNDRAKGYSGTHDRFNAATYNSVDEANEYIKSWGNDDQVVQDGDEYAILEDGEEILRNTSLSDLMMEYDEYSGFGGTAANYAVYLNVENPLVVDANGKNWDEISFNDDIVTTNQLAEYAFDEGYDGLIIDNVLDYGLYSSAKERVPQRDIVVFSSSQIKDTRNENPSENPDIRYSKVDPDEAMSRAAHDYAYDTSHEMLLYYEDIINNLQDKDAASAYKKAQKFAEKDVDKFYAGLQWYSDGIKFDDAVLEEGRERMASSKADFFASNEARWNERWLTEGRVLEARSVRSPIRKLVMSVMQNSDTNSKYKTDLVNKTIVDARMAYYYAKQGRTDIADAMLWHSALRMIEDVDFIDDTVFKDYKDLRDYLRTTNISLNDEYWADIDYQTFRKRNYNKINLVSGDTNVDQIYQEMCELWPEWFKEDEEMTPPDQLARIEQVLNAIQPYRIAYSSEEAAEMAFDIASDLTRIIREDGKEYKSIADRYKEKYDQKTKALKERHQEALREANEKQKDLEKKAKAQFKEYKAEQREKKYHDKYFDSIQKTHKELTKRLLTNTKDKHIPEQYKRELANLLAAFDFQTVRSKKLEMKEGADGYVRRDVSSKKTIQMRMLQGTLRGIENSTQMFRLNDSITDIMDNLLGTELGTYSEAMNVEGKTIDELNSDQLKKIDKMLKALLHEFNSYEDVRVGKKKEKAAKIGAAQIESSLAHAAKYGVGKDYHNFMGALDRIVNMDELTPAYLFRQVDAEGDGIGIMFGELRKSFDKYVRNQAQLNEWIGEIVGKYHEKGILWNKYGSGELTKWRSVNYQKEFMLENGKSVKLTPAQMMSIHCLAKRTQAKNHMTGAGIVVKPVSFEAKLISDLKQKANYALPVALSDSDIRMIENELTPEQTEVADKLQELMATKMAEWGNEASMNVLGIRLFEDKDYFPIKSDKSALEKDFDPQQFNEMIKNFGFTKAVAPGARNAIAIDDIFDVVSEHCNNMNLYNAYTEALNDFTKVYNYHQLGPGDSDYSVEQAIAHAYSQKATTFIRTFIQDLNGNVSRGRASGLTDVMNDMLGKAKKASVFANGRVALQQPTALVRAFAVMDIKYLKGFKAPTKANLQEMFDHCPIALWKSWGYYDINMGKSVEDLMMNNGSWAEDTMSDIYGKLDNATWCVIWNMCKAEVEDKHPDVKKGTDEYWELCNERMTEVVDLTQVVDSPFHRSHAMRDKGILQKMSTAFMAEPTLTYNMVRDGVKRMREAYVSGNKAEAAKIIGRTMSVFVAQAAAVAGAAAIWDAVRGKKPDKDDEDDKFFHLWWANAVENFKDNLKLWNNIYYVKDVSSLFDGWNISNLGLQGFVHLRDAWFQLTGKKKVQSSLTWYENAFAGAGYLTGMPFKTIMNDSKAIMGIFGLDLTALSEMPFKTIMNDSKANMGIFGLDLTALSLLDDEFTRSQSAVQDLMGGEASANGFTKTSSDGGSKTTDDKREAKAEDKSEGNGLPTAVRGWTYDGAPFHVEDGSLADKFLNHFGVNLTAAEISAIEEAEAEKKLKAKIDDIKAKTESLSGEEKDKKVWSYVQSYMKAENGDKSWSELVAEGDYASIGSIEAMYVRAGGNSEYFDGRVMAESKSALKKSISSDNTPEQIQAQAQIRDYLLNNGMEPAEVSEIAYKSYTARDLKVAFRINDKEAMLTELRALVQAGLTEEDYQKLWDNRNRLDIKKYKESGGKYADRLKSTGVYNWPINGSITSRFGHRSSPGGVGSTNHQGLDIAGSMGDPVGASDGGTVVYAGWYGGAGKTVMIEHDDGTVTQYSHLSWYDAQPGDIVAQGQYIGKVGSTGNSTGPHLHFGVKVNGVYQDPETYLANR